MQESPRYMPVHRPCAISPLRRAAETALFYMLMCAVYIVLSSRYAAAVASSQHDLQHIETTKGIAFIAVTGLIYFAISFARFRKIHRQEETIAAQELALLKTERKIMGAMSFAVIAHDLNNLLLPMNTVFEDLHRQKKGDASLQAACGDIENGLGNISRLCKRIAASTAHVLPDREERIDMDEALPKLVAIARKHPDVRFCTISMPDLPPLSLVLNRVLLEEAILNLLINAAQATGPTGHIELRLLDDKKNAILAIHDDGPGIPEDQVDSIFDPCFTTKPDGSGIGLVAVKAFASSCGGDISVSKSPLGGALFQIRIPMNKPEEQPH